MCDDLPLFFYSFWRSVFDTFWFVFDTGQNECCKILELFNEIILKLFNVITLELFYGITLELLFFEITLELLN